MSAHTPGPWKVVKDKTRGLCVEAAYDDFDAAELAIEPVLPLLWNLAMRRAGRDAGDPIRDLPLIRRAFLRDRRLAESYGLIRQAVVPPVCLPDAKLDNWRTVA